MLSMDVCRRILGSDCPLSDAEVEALRDELYEVAAIALDVAADGQNERQPERRLP